MLFLLNGLAGACPKGEERLAVMAAAALYDGVGDIVRRRLLIPGAVLRLAAVKSDMFVIVVTGEIPDSYSAESNVAILSFINFDIPFIYNRISSTLSSVPYSASLIPFRAFFEKFKFGHIPVCNFEYI